MKKIKKIAIANRAEIAVRVIRAAKELGLETVLLHSAEDIGGFAYRLADEKVCIGEGTVSETYLNQERNIQGALASGAQAVHPGFGFLSESSEFALLCEKNNLKFIGPSSQAIALFGDKVAAKKQAIQSGIPVIKGQFVENYEDINQKDLEFPVLVKAAKGGGGRGLRVAYSLKELQEAMTKASEEALTFFGSGEVFLEKFLINPKHIEIQIFGDLDGKVYSLGARNCSVQRKYQKIIEEAGSVQVASDLLRKMSESACRLAVDANYKGAGTVEFLVEGDEYYFMEMNTRLQVEHPITECVCSVDLVKAQLRLASGLSPNWDQEDLSERGHSIECRIYAEDPYNYGAPSTGKIQFLHLPYAPHCRFDFGYEQGDNVTPFYDSMIGKVIVYDESRTRALKKMIKVLNETVLFGVKTNIPFLKEVITHIEFVEGTFNNNFVNKYFPEGLKKLEDRSLEDAVYEQLKVKVPQKKKAHHSVMPSSLQKAPSHLWLSSREQL